MYMDKLAPFWWQQRGYRAERCARITARAVADQLTAHRAAVKPLVRAQASARRHAAAHISNPVIALSAFWRCLASYKPRPRRGAS